MAGQGAAVHDALAERDGLIRSALADRGRPLFRIAVSAIVSSFLFAFIGLWSGVLWLTAIVALELAGAVTARKIMARDTRYRAADRALVLAVSLCWVVHAVLLWRHGGDIAQVAAIMDLFTVSLYGALGAHKDRTLMLALIVPPLAVLSFLLTHLLWSDAGTGMAIFGTLATLGACATILLNGLALHESDKALTAANAELARLAEEAQQANLAKDSFLANMSHEIRTPLNGVIGLAASLLSTELDDRQREMAGLIAGSGEMLERLLTDLLDLAKAQSQAFKLHVAPFDLRQTVEAAAHLMRVRADDKGVRFDTRYGPAAEGRFEGDAVRIRQIVANLASNAVKFTQTGSVLVSVDVKEPDNDAPAKVTIEVRDTGIGFDSEAAQRLFGRFEQADSSVSARFGGTGLGLAICKALCEAMGGTIEAESTPGKGSIFTVVLPLPRAEMPGDADERHDAALTASGAAEGRLALRVLLAEDNAVNQRVIALLLSPLGVSLTIAGDGHAAVKAFSQSRFDLVLMDMLMPEMDGLEAVRQIRRLEQAEGRQHTPIAMLSAHAGPEPAAESFGAGCDGFITKPVTLASIREGVRQTLAKAAETAPGAADEPRRMSAHS